LQTALTTYTGQKKKIVMIHKIKHTLKLSKGWFGEIDNNKQNLVTANNTLVKKVNELIDHINNLNVSNDPIHGECYSVQTNCDLEARALVKYKQMRDALFEIKANMWRNWKYDEESLTLDSLREKVFDIFEDHGIHDSDIGL
jgi:hypothetical protein